MLLRLTPQTALPTARQLSQDLLRWLDETGNVGPAPQFRDALQGLQSALAGNWLGIDFAGDVHLLRMLLELPSLQATLENGKDDKFSFPRRNGGLLLHHVDLSAPPANRVGALVHPILLVGVLTDGASQAENLDLFLEERPLAVFIGSKPDLFHLPLGDQWVLESALTVRELEVTSVGRLLTAAGDALFDALLAYSVVASLDSVSSGLDLALDQELRGLKAKKAVVLQRVATSQQRTGPGIALELVGELRQRIQRQFSDFERGLTDRLQSLFVPQVGVLARLVDEHLEAITELPKEAQHGKIPAAIPEEVETDLVTSIRSEVSQQFSNDLVALRDLFRLVQQDLESYLESRGAPPIVPQFQFLEEERKQRLLDNTFVLQRRYSGEIKPGGFFEYAMASRRYLSLLFMGLSSFGLLSYFRRSPVIMLPITFLVLMIGGLLTVNSARKERAETSRRELDKARDVLRNEFKRIFADVQRGWSNILSQHLSEQLQQTIYRAEAGIRDFQSRQVSDAADEKQRIQRQLQTLETAEKRLQIAAKGRETIGKAVSQTRGELKQLVMTLVKQQPKVGG